MHKLSWTFLLLALGLAMAAIAQPARQALNLYPDDGYPSNGTGTDRALNAHGFLTVQGKVFFIGADAQALFPQVGVTDGTPLGTRYLPSDHFLGECRYGPKLLGSVRNLAFWVQCASEFSGVVLWRSDGTTAGTVRLTDESLQMPGFFGSTDYPAYAFADGFLYFEGCDFSGSTSTTCRVWRTDGTREGTRAVTEGERRIEAMAGVGKRAFFVANSDTTPPYLAVTGAGGTLRLKSFGSFPRLLTAAGNKLFFLAGEIEGGEELWVSDGTVAGTRPVSRFMPDQPFEPTGWLKAIGNRVYFLANDVEHGVELWRSDGTTAGTVRVSEIGYHAPFHEEMRPSHVAETTGGRVVFLATDDLESVKLFVSSGTPASTTPLTDVCLGECNGSNFDFDPDVDLALLPGGRVVFTTGRRVEDGKRTVWTTDGTPAGTFRIASDARTRPFALRGAVFFGAGTQIWRTDGTVAGTRPFSGLTPPTFLSGDSGQEIAAAGSRIVFQASDGFNGTELWASDGRPGGTELLGPLLPAKPPGSEPTALTELNGQLLFAATTPAGGRRLWRTLGSEETTLSLAGGIGSGCGGADFDDAVRAGGKIYFSLPNPQSFCEVVLWVTDGTPAGTRSLEVNPFSKVEHQGKLAYATQDALWKTDGTVAGTVKLLDLPEEARGPFGLTSVGQDLYFVVEEQSVNYSYSIWKSDGTPAGTRRLTTVLTGIFERQDPKFTRAGGFVYFRTPDEFEADIWRTDGTPEGTIRLLESDHTDLGLTDLIAFQDSALFFLRTASNEDILYRTNGTPEGTIKLRTFRSTRLFDSDAHFPVPFGGQVYFAADGGQGVELWRTDGTAAGTVLVRDIFPGEPSSWVRHLTVAGSRLVFQARDGVHGAEVWQSDGTTAGTRIVQDLYPGLLSSDPGPFTLAGDKLYFAVDDGVTGRELWYLPLAATGACQPSDKALCLNGGRFRVEAEWKTPNGKTGPGYARSLTADTGYFFFFDDDNVETVLKVLDGRGINGHFWVYYGALSNVEYNLTVTDTQTGLARRYFNPQTRFASVGDAEAFGPRGAYEVKSVAAPSPAPEISERLDLSKATGTCVPAATRLCLNQGRFAVEVAWEDFSGNQGAGKAVGLTGDTGYFWFFNDANVETVIKVLDGTAVNGKFWVYYGALSDVKYDLTVTDTLTGKQKVYRNPKGRFASAGDPDAF